MEYDLEYKEECTGSHNGQADMVLGIYIDNEVVGMVQYVLYGDELTVSDIIVKPEYRRMGFGSKMMEYIKKGNPEYTYKPSMKTTLGSKFKHKEIKEKYIMNFSEFLNESISIHKGDFKVTEDMVSNGMLIKELIPREVIGAFDCYALELTSLIGCPESIGRYFDCSDNKLTSLIGCPESVGESFYCSYNKLTTLEGGPKEVGISFYCSDNQLTSLEGSPNEVSGSFQCYTNQLTTLEGSPETVGGDFYCSNNLLSSLEGGPKSVGGDFYISGNKADLYIESDYIMSDFRKDKYYLGLLKYMISNDIDLTEVKVWPEDFLTPELIQSAKGISKFKL